MTIAPETREAMKARAYLLDVLAGMVPSDPEFEEVWDLIPAPLALDLQDRGGLNSAGIVEIADQVRAVKRRRYAAFIDNFQA